MDGKPAGQTPTSVVVEADGKAHEFTFTLPGYEVARYRFPPVRDGVVFGTLKPARGEDGRAAAR